MRLINYRDNKEIRKDVEPLFITAFPQNERPPADYYFSSFSNPNNQLFGFYDEDKFVGFSSITLYKDICYIFFLTIKENERDKGYGSQAISLIKEKYRKFAILICYEEVDEKYPDYLNRKRREQFYYRNGFKKNPLMSNEFGVIYQTAVIGNRIVTFEEYQEIFKSGFGEHTLQYLQKYK